MPDFITKRELLERLLTETKVLQTAALRKAFSVIDRKDFVPPDYEVEAYEDYPLPIGYGQTISQPTTVAFMLGLLDVREGDLVLDIGSGSGWTTALLAALVGHTGSVLGIERIPKLVECGRNNLAKYKFPHASIAETNDERSRKGKSLYNKILVSAAADEIPQEFIDRLSPGGTMVIPINDAVVKIMKDESTNITTQEFPGFVFVPLVQ